MESDDTVVVFVPGANDEPCRFGTVDEANRAVVTKEEIVGNFADGRPSRIIVTSNGKQELVLSGRQTSGTCLLLTPSIEVAQASSERKQTCVGRVWQSQETALVIDVGRRILPTITPDDADAVERILAEHTANT